jgi:hypothetical protein
MRGYPQWRGRLDEAFVKLSGKLCYVRRAVDHEGQVFASKWDNAVALELLKRIMQKYGRPRRVVTEGLRVFSAAMNDKKSRDVSPRALTPSCCSTAPGGTQPTNSTSSATHPDLAALARSGTEPGRKHLAVPARQLTFARADAEAGPGDWQPKAPTIAHPCCSPAPTRSPLCPPSSLLTSPARPLSVSFGSTAEGFAPYWRAVVPPSMTSTVPWQ